MTDATTGDVESKRGRVKRLLIDPLVEDGMRFRKGTDEATAKSRINRIADDLAYMSDEGLTALRRMLATMGEGSARCFWPGYVTIRGLSQRLEPAPFDDDPKLIGWWRAEADKQDWDLSIQVAAYQFLKAKLRLPLSDAEYRAVGARAGTDAHRAEVVQERIDRGIDPGEDDAKWLCYYRRLEARVQSLKGKPAAAATFQSARAGA